MPAVAIVLGAGLGLRLGRDTPKALLRAGGQSLLHRSAVALAGARGVAAVVCVLPRGADAEMEFGAIRDAWPGPARLEVPALGGASRQASLAAGLRTAAARAPEAEWVLVHDAARCFVEPADAEAVLAAARATGAAIPVVPIGDTLKRVADGAVAATLDRERHAFAQTPQAFRAATLREALEKAEREGYAGTDCASLVERLGVAVRTCPGRKANWKVTTQADLERAEAILAGEGGAA